MRRLKFEAVNVRTPAAGRRGERSSGTDGKRLSALAQRLRSGDRDATLALAAVLGKVSEQRVHLRVVGRVVDEAPVLPRLDHSRVS